MQHTLNCKKYLLILLLLCLGGFPVDHAQAITPESTSGLKPIKPVAVSYNTERYNAFLKNIETHFSAGDRLLMPLGFFAVTNHISKTNEMKQLVENGMTFIHRYDSTLTLTVARRNIVNSKKAGIPLAINLPHKQHDMQWWRNFLKDLVKDNQIIFWHLPEEPKPEDMEYINDLANLIHEIDPLHRPVATYLNLTDNTYLTKAAKSLDFIVYGAYPGHGWVGGARLRIARKIDKAYSCHAPAVMAALESFNTKTLGWPKPKHVLFDTYISLIHGAKGIWWYGYHFARDNAELLDAILARTKILNGPEYLGEVFLRGKDSESINAHLISGPEFFPSNKTISTKMRLAGKLYKALQWRAIDYRGNTYIAAVNGSQFINKYPLQAKEDKLIIKAVFSGFNPESKITLLDGVNSYDHKDGSLTVTLEPLATIVLKISDQHLSNKEMSNKKQLIKQ
ncbi:MAG TPA: hypothetical protein ENH94_01580 [Phycisphaerales bacterium]|nr:hypothetical protein [Phycisphaerales bacterium]